jgi:hypothetical protein
MAAPVDTVLKASGSGCHLANDSGVGLGTVPWMTADIAAYNLIGVVRGEFTAMCPEWGCVRSEWILR